MLKNQKFICVNPNLMVSPTSVVEATIPELNRKDAKNAKKFKKSSPGTCRAGASVR
jgi:hypothetical protein